MENIKERNIKNRIYYFFDDMINSENFNLDLLKIDKKSYNSTGIYYIVYIAMKNSDYIKINSVKPLYSIIGKADDQLRKKMEINT